MDERTLKPKNVVVCANNSNAKPVSVSGTSSAGGGHDSDSDSACVSSLRPGSGCPAASPTACNCCWEAKASMARRSASMQCATCSPLARACVHRRIWNQCEPLADWEEDADADADADADWDDEEHSPSPASAVEVHETEAEAEGHELQGPFPRSCASPAAYTSGALVRMCRSTSSPPSEPVAIYQMHFELNLY